MNERRYDIDWLRVIAIFGVFLFHCARFFVSWGWHLTDTRQSVIAEVLLSLLVLWGMPLFFLLSGSASWYALERRTGGRYLLERVQRLLIPLYTVGLFVLLPPQYYIDRVHNGGYSGTFWEILPRYFGLLGRFGLNDPTELLPFTWSGHLWFLQYLFLTSLATLPLLLYLRTERGRRLIQRLAGWCEHWGGVFLFIVPLALVRLCLRGLFSGEHTWADWVEYGVFFLIGYLMAADERFIESVKRHKWAGLILGIAGFVGLGVLLNVAGYSYPQGESFSWTYVLFQILFSIASWGWVVFVRGLGAKHLNRANRLLAYSGEAIMPFYMFHQTIILGLGWFVIPWDMGILPKYLIISVGSFLLIFALYELFVRRFNVVRFFFGMRPTKKETIA
jgi:peptidoglycan/LPS O-acetylase OafA/YrhL